jgi:hypothetical protein
MGTSTQPPDAQSIEIGDARFMKRVAQILALRDFIVREMQDVQKSMPTRLACDGLYAFRFGRAGRDPVATEWNCLESKFYDLNDLITSEQRKKFILSQFPLVIIYVAIGSLAISMVSLFFAVYPKFLVTPTDDYPTFIRMLAFVLWTICLGALGSIAFISVNALSMQSDATFDVTNTRFVLLRIILGALFGVLIALPVGYEEFWRFCDKLASPSAGSAPTGINSSQALYLLLPFLVGFSASLFMTIISKFIAGVQSLFGVEGPRNAALQQGQPPQAAATLPGPRSMMG